MESNAASGTEATSHEVVSRPDTRVQTGHWRKLVDNPYLESVIRLSEYVAKVGAAASVIWAAFTFIPQTKAARYASAWQTINASYGHTGSGGRSEALESLAAGHQPLDGVNVSGAYLVGLKLPNQDLNAADFSNTALARASFVNAVLTSASFEGSDISGATFAGAYLDNANFRETFARDPDTVSAVQMHAAWRAAPHDFKKEDAIIKKDTFTLVSFHNAELESAVFDQATLYSADFSIDAPAVGESSIEHPLSFRNAVLERATFDKRDLSYADFYNADLEGSRFINTDLESADFRKADLGSVDFSRACLSNVRLEDADLSQASYLDNRQRTHTFPLDTQGDTSLVRNIVRDTSRWCAPFNPALPSSLGDERNLPKRAQSGFSTSSSPVH